MATSLTDTFYGCINVSSNNVEPKTNKQQEKKMGPKCLSDMTPYHIIVIAKLLFLLTFFTNGIWTKQFYRQKYQNVDLRSARRYGAQTHIQGAVPKLKILYSFLHYFDRKSTN